MKSGIQPGDERYEEYETLQLTLCVLENPCMHKEIEYMPELERKVNIEMVKERMEVLLEDTW